MFHQNTRPPDLPDVKIQSVQIVLLDKMHDEYEVRITLTQPSHDGDVIHVRSKPVFPVREELLLTEGLTQVSFTVHTRPMLRNTSVSIFATVKHDGKHWAKVTLQPH